MAAEGWLVIDGVEIFNNYRFKKMVDYYQSIGLLNASAIQFKKDGYPTVQPGVKTCPSTWTYPSIVTSADNPWYLAGTPESQKFVGFWVEQIEGLDARGFEREVTQKAYSGAQLSPLRTKEREVSFNFILVGTDSEGVEYGMRWLESQLTSFCSSCQLSTMQLRHNDSIAGLPERGWWQYDRVGLLSGIEWESEAIDVGCTTRRATMTLVAGNPCRYKCEQTVFASADVLASGGFATDVCASFEDFILGYDPAIPPKLKKRTGGVFNSAPEYIYAEIPASGVGVNSAVVRLTNSTFTSNFIEANGLTVTLNGGAIGTNDGLVLSGASNSYASTPDVAPLDITGDIEFVARLSATNWLPTATQSIFSKDVPVLSPGITRSYALRLETNGRLTLETSPSGNNTGVVAGSSTVAPSFVNGNTYWIKATLDVDNGGGNRVYNFWYAPDSTTEPTSWSAIGTPVTGTGTTSIFNSATKLGIGGRPEVPGSTLFAGTIKRAIIRNGIGGTSVFDADFSRGTFYSLCGAAWDIWVTCLSDWPDLDTAIANRRVVMTVVDMPASGQMIIDSANKDVSLFVNGIEMDHPWQYVAFQDGTSFDWIDCSDCSSLLVGLAPNNPAAVQAQFEVGFIHREGCI